MTKLTPLSRAAAQVVAVLGACLTAMACSGTALASAPAAANDESQALNLGAGPSQAHTSTGGASLVRTIVGLAIVIAVIWGLYWILRQVKAGREPQVSSAGQRELPVGRGPHESVRHDPMRMPAPGTSLVERLRELTVRR